jgi:hypothetical protein
VPAELLANRMQWLIRFCVIRCYVSVMWRPGVHRSVWLRCQVRAEQLPDDDNHVSKHVGAAK